MHSFLYERLAASRDEAGVLQLANNGQIIEKPEDALKSPVILDFLGYKDHHNYSENNLEIIHYVSYYMTHNIWRSNINREKMDHFPQALASGYAFCNRKNEMERLKFNLIESRPTLIVSPRRYGKTSLALHKNLRQTCATSNATSWRKFIN